MKKTSVRKIGGIFEKAEREGRDFLLEAEVYEVLAEAGITPPRHVFLPKGAEVSRRALASLGTDSAILKTVSPLIVHKSDVGGVAVVPNRPSPVREACARMIRTVPERYRRWIRANAPDAPETSLTLSEIRDSIRGFLVCEKVAYESVSFGSEILLGVRNSRDFGPVLTLGGGGTDVEHMSGHLKEGSASFIASAHLFREEGLLEHLEPLAFFGKIAGDFRGRRPVLPAGVLEDTCVRFSELAAAFSPQSDLSPFVIEEMEVNPFVIREKKLVPLDGVCRFSRAKFRISARPIREIGRLLRPGSIGIVGVSDKMNIGRVILSNVLASGFPRENVFVVKPGCDEILGCRCVPSPEDLPRPVDLFVLTLAAPQCRAVMDELVEHGKARSVIIIAGGMGEKKGGGTIEDGIRSLLARGREEGRLTPVVNGGNCLGIASKPGRYDTTFIPEYKLPRPKSGASGLAVISQSGAFMICRTSRLPGIEPLYAISLGNQIDLTASDYLRFLKDDPEVKVFAVYMEGFRPYDGLAFAEAVGAITAGGTRSVLVYKAGRSPEGRAATSSHTASVAGEYGVCRSVLEQAGAIVAEDIFEFESFMKGLVLLEGRRVGGGRVGLVSNAGFECVVMADNLKDGGGLEIARFTGETRKRILGALGPLGIDELQDVHNPLDVTPVADDAAFCACARAVLEDPGVDCAVISNVPMTPAQQTLPAGEGHGEDLTRPAGIAVRLAALLRATEKPVVLCVDGGHLYDPLVRQLENAGVPVFRRADEAVRFLRKFVNHRLGARVQPGTSEPLLVTREPE